MVTENIYNSLGQIEKVNTGKKGDKKEDGCYSIDGEVHTEEYAYDDLGRTDKITDAEGGVSSVVFDSLGRIVSLKDPNQNAADAEGKTWSLNSGNTYTYVYNDKGLLYKETNALNNTTTYEYNAKLLLEQMTDSAEETTRYEYDSLNRPWKIKDSLGTIEYAYDANGNVLTVSEKESLLSLTKTITRTYDKLNRVTSYTDYKGREVKYGYDELGNLMELTYPGGEIVRYEYNPDGNVHTMTSNSGSTYIYGYDNYGRLSRIERPDGSIEERTYNAAGQLTEQVDRDKSGNILQNNIYKYDVFGEIIEKTTSTEGDLSKLISVTMEYDAANRLTKYNGEDVIYDVKGNMTYGPVDGEMTELTYDVRNRLVKAGKVSYTYDCENTRIATTEDGITTEYVTDTGGSLSRLLIAYENIGTANTSETHYYYGAEGVAAQNNDTTEQYFVYHYDNIGSTTIVTDKTGRKIEEFAYGTYGELLTEVVNNIRFLYNGSYGVVTDSNGLYYMRARYYNPDIKRFINQDIKVGDISNGQGLNRYAYCEGNPVSMVDPFGLCGENAGDQGEPSKYEHLHNLLSIGGMVWDGFDLINGFLYAKEKKGLDAAICFACAVPFAGNLVAGISRACKAVQTADKIIEFSCKIGKLGNTVAAVKGFYETCQTANTKCKTIGGKIAYVAGTMAAGFIMGKAAKWGSDKLKSMVGKAIPRMKTAVQDGTEKLISKISSGSGVSSGSGMMRNRNRGYVYWPFGGSKGGSESRLYRKAANTGEFKGLHETMQARNVKNIAKKAGIGLDGVKIKIDRNAELVGKGIYGYTDGKTITLYPDAFTDTETLVKTLGHERMHVYQTSIFGKPTSSDILQEFENGAYASESSWWQYFQSGGK